MGISRFLNHRVSIVRKVAVLDDDEPVLDAYGQPTTTDETLASAVAAGIQPKSAEEVAAISQAGAASSTHTIYFLPRDVSTADQIVHTSDDCPATNDLPDGTYQVVTVPDAAGAGHHIEISARLVSSAQSAYAVPVGAGS